MTVDVWTLPARTAHVVHALMFGTEPGGGGAYGPFTTAEVCVWDAPWEALTPRHTAAALRHAQRLGLVAYVPGGYWIPTNRALEQRRVFGERFLRDEELEGRA